MNKACLTVVAFLAAALTNLSGIPAAAQAAPPEKPIFDRNWIAASSTAMAITGDMRMTPDSITFNRRVTFKLRFVAEVVSKDPERYWSDIPSFSLYEIVQPKQPTAILRGNTLCGNLKFSNKIQPATYIAVGYDAEARQLELVTFSSKTPPEVSLRSAGACGNLGYFIDK
jgi:hypothetical protein